MDSEEYINFVNNSTRVKRLARTDYSEKKPIESLEGNYKFFVTITRDGEESRVWFGKLEEAEKVFWGLVHQKETSTYSEVFYGYKYANEYYNLLHKGKLIKSSKYKAILEGEKRNFIQSAKTEEEGQAKKDFVIVAIKEDKTEIMQRFVVKREAKNEKIKRTKRTKNT